MITLKQDIENKFLIYKTQITGINNDSVVTLENEMSERKLTLDFTVTESLRAYTVLIPETDFKGFEGQNKLIIENESVEIIYTDLVRI